MGNLISSTPMLQLAREGGYAITAFNVHSLEMLQAVSEAAQEMEAPLIIQTTVGTVQHLGADYIVAAARTAAMRTDVPIALHLDHCRDPELIARCIKAGYTSVMIDASMHTFDENVSRTREVVQYAISAGVNVEAELGRIGGVEDELEVDDADTALADPEECARFVALTGVSTLAPAIGTAHGLYRGRPRIDFDRLERIADKVEIPLVLHGGSGIPADQVHRCIARGMAKMNVATELKVAFSNEIRRVLTEHPEENDPRAYLLRAKLAVKQVACDKIRLSGCAGHARRLGESGAAE